MRRPIVLSALALHAARVAFAAAMTLLVSSCASDSTAPRSVAVRLEASRTAASPTQSVHLTMTATPSGGARVTEMELRPLGIAAAAPMWFPIASGTAAPYVVTADVTLPADVGDARFVAVAHAGDLAAESDTLVVHVADATPPVIDSISTSYTGEMPAGAWLTVNVAAHDDVRLRSVVVRYAGALAKTDSTGVARADTALSTSELVSGAAPVGAPLQVVVEVRDVGGNVTRRTLSLTVVDRMLPSLAGGTTTFCPTGCAVGDTQGFIIRATDEHRLAWMGYRLGGAMTGGDSVASSAQVDSMSFAVRFTSAGPTTITLFVRDSSGNEATRLTSWNIVAALRQAGMRER